VLCEQVESSRVHLSLQMVQQRQYTLLVLQGQALQMVETVRLLPLENCIEWTQQVRDFQKLGRMVMCFIAHRPLQVVSQK